MGKIKRSLFSPVLTERLAVKIAEAVGHFETSIVTKLSRIEKRLSTWQKKLVLILYVVLFGGYLFYTGIKAVFSPPNIQQVQKIKTQQPPFMKADTIYLNRQQ